MTWLWLAAATMVVVALVHSVVGERRLVGPILTINTGVVARPLGRQVLRFAWHMTSVLMILCAVVVAWRDVDPLLVRIVGSAWLAAGLFDAAYTRGRHIGWPFLTAAGAFAIMGSVK